MPFFSVIIPSFNRLPTLREAVESVHRQTFRDFDCWVVDDASTDGTWEWLAAAPLDDRFHRVRNPTNRRQHYCRNRAIEQSSASWITFLDSDDVWLPERLQRFHEAIQRAPEMGFWFSNGYWLEDGRVVGRFFNAARSIPTGVLPGHYAVGARFLPYVTTNIAIRREAFSAVGLYREDMQILEDTELYARMLRHGLPVGVIPGCLSLYRFHPQQITRHYERDFSESLMALEASGLEGPELRREKEGLIRSTAIYLLKAGDGAGLRRFLDHQGAAARHPGLWACSFVPKTVLGWLRTLTRLGRRLRQRRFRHTPAVRQAEAYYADLRRNTEIVRAAGDR